MKKTLLYLSICMLGMFVHNAAIAQCSGVPSPIYVDASVSSSGTGSSWSSPVKTLSEALDMANGVSCKIEIWVKKGTYYPMAGTSVAASRDSSFRINRDSIKIYGGFDGTETSLSSRDVAANVTILSGDLGVAGDTSDNAYHVVTIIGKSTSIVDTNTRIDGFTIENGIASGSGSFNYKGTTTPQNNGGGLLLMGRGADNNCSPIITNCIIKDNYASIGGGLSLVAGNDGKSAPIISNNTFTKNEASHGGAFNMIGQSISGITSLINNQFIDNKGTNGGAIRINGNEGICKLNVNNNTFSGNSSTRGSGFYMVGVATVNVSNSTFTNNTSSAFGTYVHAGDSVDLNSTLTNCKFLNNSANNNGSVISNTAGTIKANYCVLDNNSVTVGASLTFGGAIFVKNSAAKVILNNAVVNGNQSAARGGAVTIDEGSFVATNTTFNNNGTKSTASPNSNTIYVASGSSAILNNSIVWGDSANHVSGTVTYNYSLVKGAGLTAPNFSINPMFMNPSNPIGPDGVWGTSDDGLVLNPCSPIINKGDSTLIDTSLKFDLLSAARVQKMQIELGAYESKDSIMGFPNVTVKASHTTVCDGATVTFEVDTHEGLGNAPTYEWFKNGTSVATTETYTVTGLIVTDSIWLVVENTDCKLKDTSNKISIHVIPTRIYVDGSVASTGSGLSWTAPKKSLSEALNIANNASDTCGAIEIWVKEGTYHPTDNAGAVVSSRDSSFRILRNNIKVYGGFAGTETALTDRVLGSHETILSGDIGIASDTSDNLYHVVTILSKASKNIDNNTILDGFSIEGGQAETNVDFTYDGVTISNREGGAIYINGVGANNKNAPIISNNTIRKNNATNGAGINLIANSNGQASPVIRNNTFENNTASVGGAALYTLGHSSAADEIVFVNNIVKNNVSTSTGSIRINATSNGVKFKIDSCVFESNRGGVGSSVNASGFATLNITNSIFRNDSSTNGGTFAHSGTNSSLNSILNNVEFSGNKSRRNGGAIQIETGTFQITNSVLNGNKVFQTPVTAIATSGGAGIMLNNALSTVTVTNVVFNNNTTDSLGGAILVNEGTLLSTNNTFNNNSTAKGNSNTLYAATGSSVTLNNTIVWGAADTQVVGTVTYNHSLVKGAGLTAPNLSVTPLFVDETNAIGVDGIWKTSDDGLQLSKCSPAINVGDNALLDTNTKKDILLTDRIQMTTVDLGAYESADTLIGIPDVTIAVNPSNVICAGATVTFPVTHVSMGSTPTYSWIKNGEVVSTSSEYSASDLITNDSIYLVMTNMECSISDTSNMFIMDVVPARMYVDGSVATTGSGLSWTTPKKTLSEALTIANKASDTCGSVEIWVKEGTYYPTDDTGAIVTSRDSSFRILRNNIKVYGGFAGTETLLSDRVLGSNETVLSGDLGIASDTSDNLYHVLTILSKSSKTIDTTTIVDGFTISGGQAKTNIDFIYDGITISSQEGGAIYINGSGANNKNSPIISNNIIRNNNANLGAGINLRAVSNGQSSPIIRNNMFEENNASTGGAAFYTVGNLAAADTILFLNNTINHNISGSGAVRINATSGQVKFKMDNNTFESNRGTTGSSVNISGNTKMIVTNTTFTKDSSVNGGVFAHSGTSTSVSSELIDVEFTGNNIRRSGGSLNIVTGNTIITNSVFDGNRVHQSATATSGGAGIMLNNALSTVTVTNVVFNNNTTDSLGGAILVNEGTLLSTNNTFNNNSTAKGNSNTLYAATGSSVTLNNTIVWGAADTQVVGTVTYNHSLVKGTGLVLPNLDVDPVFVDETNAIGPDGIWKTSDDGLQLTRCSEAINAGNNALLDTNTTKDILLADRIQMTTVDMGAYENVDTSYGMPEVNIAVTPNNVICEGTLVSFPVYKKAEGIGTTYEWFINGIVVSTDSTFSSTTLITNDTVWMVMTNNECKRTDTSNRIVMRTVPSRMYVDNSVPVTGNGLSWASPMNTLSEALYIANQASDDCGQIEIWVKEGTYYPTDSTGTVVTSRDSSFRMLRNNVKLYGGFAGTETLLSDRVLGSNETILSGDIGTIDDNADNLFHVITMVSTATRNIDTSTIIDGFTIRDGNADDATDYTLNGVIVNRQIGAGIYINGRGTNNKCSPIISNNIFTLNQALSGGGINLIANNNGNSNPIITDNKFVSNTATNGAAFYSVGNNSTTDTVLFARNEVSKNTSTNGAVMMNAPTGSINVLFRDNNFENNVGIVGSSINIRGTVYSKVLNNTFKNDSSSQGGTYAHSGTSINTNTEISNSLFYGNRSRQYGGAISNLIGNIKVDHTVFDSNSVVTSTGVNNGGGAISILGTDASVELINSIFNNNNSRTASGAIAVHNGTLNVTNTTFSNNATTIASNSNSIYIAAGASATLTNAIVWGEATNHIENLGTLVYNHSLVKDAALVAPNSSENPVFMDATNAKGLDEQWLTEDDGLQLAPCSPAIDAGITTTATLDIIGRSRIDSTDMGAYESQGDTVSMPVVAKTSIVYCAGITPEEIIADIATVGDTLRWFDADTIALSTKPVIITDTPATYTYYVSEVTPQGCLSNLVRIDVLINPTPLAPIATSPINYCQYSTAIELEAITTSSTDTLKWYDTDGVALSEAPVPSTDVVGSVNYYVSQKNLFGCESERTLIEVITSATPDAPSTDEKVAYCQFETPEELTAIAPNEEDTLIWYDAARIRLSTAPTPSTLVPGTYTYYVSAKTLDCEGEATEITVTIHPQPDAPVVETPLNICHMSATDPLVAEGENLLWYTTATGGTGVTSIKPSSATLGSTDFYVTQTSEFGCESPRSVLEVIVREKPVVTLTHEDMAHFVFCKNDSMVLKANSTVLPVNYTWSFETTPLPGSVDDTIHVKTEGNYTVVVTDVYGCGDTNSVFVMRNPLPDPTLEPNDVFMCPGTSVMLYCKPTTIGYKYEWKHNGFDMGMDTALNKIPVYESGFYSVVVTDTFNCVVETNPISVTEYPAMPTPTIVQTGTILRTTTTYSGYQWYRNNRPIAGANTNMHNMVFDGSYYVVVTDANGCTDTSNIIQGNGVSIPEDKISEVVKIYPNPSNGIVNVESRITLTVIVTDMSGTQILKTTSNEQIDLSQYADGVYFIRLVSEEGNVVGTHKINKIAH